MPKKTTELPPQEELKDFFEYQNGHLIWKKLSNPKAKAKTNVGNIAGCIDKHSGYRRIRYKGKCYKASRLIWAWHNGDIPKEYEIDHIDNNRSNDKIENLRLSTPSQNNQNKTHTKNNKLGVKGVSRNRQGNFSAFITINGKNKNLGSYKTIEEAKNVYDKISEQIHGAFKRI